MCNNHEVLFIFKVCKRNQEAVRDMDDSHDGSNFNYSSGMQDVMLALGIYVKFIIFGFGKSESTKHHYHTYKNKKLHLHDYEAKYDLYHDLVKRPDVILFVLDKLNFSTVVIHR